MEGLTQQRQRCERASTRTVRRHHDDSDGRQGRILAHPLVERRSIHYRHHDIQKDDQGQVGWLSILQQVESLLPVTSLQRRETLVLKNIAQALSKIRIIFHDENRSTQQPLRTWSLLPIFTPHHPTSFPSPL